MAQFLRKGSRLAGDLAHSEFFLPVLDSIYVTADNVIQFILVVVDI